MGDVVGGGELGELGAGQQAPGGGQDERAAREQRHGDVPEGRVEARGGELQHPVVRSDGAALDLVREQAGDPGVADHHALGPPGGPRGVDDVRGVRGNQRGEALAVRHVGGGQVGDAGHRPRVVQEDGGDRVGEHVGGLGRGQYLGRPRVLQHVADAVGGVVGVHREVGRSRLEDGEHGDHHLQGARHRQRDHLLRADALGDEVPGEPVGPGVELGVGQPGALEDGGGPVRDERRLGLEELGGGRVRELAPRPLPALQQVLALPGGEDLQPADGDVGGVGRRLQQQHEAGQQPLRRLPVEEVAAVLQRAVDAAGRPVRPRHLAEHEGQVEARAVGVTGLDPGGEAGHAGDLPGRFAQRQHDLEERVPGQRPGRVEGLHQPVEGQVLVLVGGQVGGADAVEQLVEGRGAGGVRAQHEGVDEAADEVVQRLVAAARDGGAEGDVLPRAQTGEQGGETGLEDHEEGGSAVPAQA